MLAILLVSVTLVLYLVVITKHKYWKRKNTPGPVPTFFGGNIGDIFSGKKSLGDVYTEIYRFNSEYNLITALANTLFTANTKTTLSWASTKFSHQQYL